MVYRLITENTIEEKMIERQLLKLKWDSILIQYGNMKKKKGLDDEKDIFDMIKFGANKIFKSDQGTYTEETLEEILKRGEKKIQQYMESLEQQFNK